MANLFKKIIKHQTIRVDDHSRNTVHDWGKPGIHVHKVCNTQKATFDILIPLNYDEAPSIRCNGGVYGIDDLDRKVRKEIMEVLGDKNKRYQFCNEIFGWLEWFNWERNNENEQKIIDIVSKAFDLQKIDYYDLSTNGHVTTHVQMLTDNTDVYSLVLNYQKKYLRIGQSENEDIFRWCSSFPINK